MLGLRHPGLVQEKQALRWKEEILYYKTPHRLYTILTIGSGNIRCQSFEEKKKTFFFISSRA